MRSRSDVHHGFLGVGGGGAGAAGPVGGAWSVGGGAAGAAGDQPGRGQVDRQAPAAAAGRARHLHAGLCHRHFHSPRSRWARQYLVLALRKVCLSVVFPGTARNAKTF